MEEDLLFQIYSIVEEIPEGKVSTYGDIAKMSGHDRNSRLVGKALTAAAMYGEFPCHRVVNSRGRLVPWWYEQKSLLLKENVKFLDNGYVDLKKHRWKI